METDPPVKTASSRMRQEQGMQKLRRGLQSYLARDILITTSMRLFVAFPLPAKFRKEMASLTNCLLANFPLARPVSPENYHLTLLFLGQRPPETEMLFKKIAAEWPREPLTVTPHRLSFIPSGNLPRILALDFTEEKNLFQKYQQEFAIKLNCEYKVYPPHLTLARLNSQTKLVVDPKILEKQKIPRQKIVLDQLGLYQSLLKVPHAQYRLLYSAKLSYNSK